MHGLAELDEQDRDRPAIAKVTGALEADRRQPVGAGIELDRPPGPFQVLVAPAWGGLGSFEERLDVLGRSFVQLLVMVMLGQDELPRPAWSGRAGRRRRGRGIGGIGHGRQV